MKLNQPLKPNSNPIPQNLKPVSYTHLIANPLVRLLERRLKIVRKHGSMLIIIGTLALVVLVGYLAISKIITELGSFVGNLPEMYESVSMDFAEAGQKLSVFFQKLPQGVRSV